MSKGSAGSKYIRHKFQPQKDSSSLKHTPELES